MVLNGANDIFKNNVHWIRVEVEFDNLYKSNKQTFQEVSKILNKLGFRFINFDIFSSSFKDIVISIIKINLDN